MMFQQKSVGGSDFAAYIGALGELRIKVFAEWPYLYQGDLDYEKNYLKTYSQTQKSFVHMIFDNDKLIGATTAIWLADEALEFQKPFLQKGIDPQRVVYFGESLVLPEYRRQGLGKVFMQKRLDFAKNLAGIEHVAFCSVIRSSTDLRRPSDYRPLDEFWLSQGFVPQEDMVAQYPWRDIGETEETIKNLKFWMKSIN